MSARLVYNIALCLVLLGILALAPTLDHRVTHDACGQTGLQCSVTVAHVFGY